MPQAVCPVTDTRVEYCPLPQLATTPKVYSELLSNPVTTYVVPVTLSAITVVSLMSKTV